MHMHGREVEVNVTGTIADQRYKLNPLDVFFYLPRMLALTSSKASSEKLDSGRETYEVFSQEVVKRTR